MEKEFQKKMRIQLFDNEFNQLDDRLVFQDTEMYKGPKEPHKGPMKVEFCLFQKDDVDGCIAYVKKIMGDLPIEVKIRKSKASVESADDRETLLGDAVAMENQDGLIKFLRSKGFIFLTAVDVEDYELFEVPTQFKDYQFMLQLVKEAKDPANNKYDLALIFAIKILDSKVDSYGFKLYNEAWALNDLPWKAKDKKFPLSKANLTKFPTFMYEDERLAFSKELAKIRRAIQAGENPTPTKNFKRRMAFVEFAEKSELLTRLEFKMEV